MLRRGDFGEDGRLVTLLTPTDGKKTAIAKGARRPGSRLGSHLEPFTQCRLYVAMGRNLDVITGAATVESFPALRDNLLATTAAWYAVELVDRATDQGMDCRQLYDLLVAFLRRLDRGGEPDALLSFFSMRLLSTLGFRLSLGQCTGCGAQVDATSGLFSALSGGMLCRACSGGANDARRVSAAAFATLRLWQSGSYDAWEARPAPAAATAEASGLLRECVRAVLEREPRSARVYERVRVEDEYQATASSRRAPA